MKNFRKLTTLVVLLITLSVPVLAGSMETPPAPAPPPPPSEPATSEPAPGSMETPPAAMVVTETVFDLVLTVVGLL